jgi:hypothetical protein
MTKLFLDDIREPDWVYDLETAGEFIVVRTFEEFQKHILTNGLPDFIRFDNDPGLDDQAKVAYDGYHAAKWLVYESGLNLRNLKFHVHSASPVPAEQIRGLLNNYIRFLNEN